MIGFVRRMIHHILEVYRPHQTDQQKLANPIKKKKKKQKLAKFTEVFTGFPMIALNDKIIIAN